MAKLIKSILANRMMFRGGGLVPPSQAAGILASSSPLIDSVTLNEGGPVNFANGGMYLGARPAANQQSAPGLQDLQTQPFLTGPDSYLGSVENAIQKAVDAGAKDFNSVVDYVARALGETADNATRLVQEVTDRAASFAREGADVAVGTAKEAWMQGMERQSALLDALKRPHTLLPEGPLKDHLDKFGVEDVVDYWRASETLEDNNRGRSTPPPEERASETLMGLGPPPGSREEAIRQADLIARNGPNLFEWDSRARDLLRKTRPDIYDMMYATWEAKSDSELVDLTASGQKVRGALDLFKEERKALVEIDPAAIEYDAYRKAIASGKTPEEALQTASAAVTAAEQADASIAEKEFFDRRMLKIENLYRGESGPPGQRVPYEGPEAGVDDPFPTSLSIRPGVGPASKPPEYDGMDLEGRFTGEDEAEAVVTNEALIDKQEQEQALIEEQEQALIEEQKIDRPKPGSSAAQVEHGIITTAEDDDPEELKDWLKIFKKEFIDTIPKYEGASDFEKSMAWVKTGLAIAAGTSPFAIKNIADGFLATIDEHTKDAKEKREYERQINLSAANYALAANNKRKEEKRALELDGKKPIEVMTLMDVKDENGNVLYEKGKIAYVPYSMVQNNPEQFGGEHAIEAYTDSMVKNASSFTALLERQMKLQVGNTAERTKQYAAAAKDYEENAENVSKQLNMYGLISSSLEIAEDNTITGFKGYVAKLLNQGANFLNLELRKEDEAAGKVGGSLGSRMAGTTDEQLAEAAIKAGENKEQDWRSADERLNDYKEQRSLWSWFEKNVRTGKNMAMYDMQQQRLANLLIRELLGEGSKNISNIDRDLAQQIVGLYEDYLFADPEVLRERLMAIELGIRRSYTTSVTKMNKFEDQWGAYSVGPIKTDTTGLPLPRSTVQEVVADPVRQNVLAFAAQEGQFGTSVPVEQLTKMQEILDATGTYKINDKGIYVLTKG